MKQGLVPGSAMFLLVLPLLLLSGCCGHLPFTPHAAELPYPLISEPSEDAIVHVATGRELSRPELFGLLSDARVIYISEAHNNVEAHRVQAEIIEAMVSWFPGQVVLGLEMFAYTAQPELDRLLEAGFPEAEFERLWDDHWNVDPGYYTSVIGVVRRHRIPILGLNAPKDVVRGVSSGGKGSPSGQELAAIDVSDPYQREFISSIYGGHAQGAGMLDRFLLVQSLWEETMAEKAAAFLRSDEGREKKMIILAGGHHINYGFGIPRRLFRRLPLTSYSVNPEFYSYENVPREDLMDVETPALPLRISDFIWYVRYQEPALRRAILGVAVKPAEGGGVRILHVLEGSVAEKAGLQPDDVIVSLEGIELRDRVDLTRELRKVTQGQEISFLLRRGDQPIVQRIRFDTLTVPD